MQEVHCMVSPPPKMYVSTLNSQQETRLLAIRPTPACMKINFFFSNIDSSKFGGTKLGARKMGGRVPPVVAPLRMAHSSQKTTRARRPTFESLIPILRSLRPCPNVYKAESQACELFETDHLHKMEKYTNYRTV
jgi:hypothetical protein